MVADASKLCLAVCFTSFIFISYYSCKTMRCSFWTGGKLNNITVTENVWLIYRSQSDMLAIIYIQHVLRLLVKCIISNTKETQWSSHTHKQDPYVHLHLPLFFAVGKLCFKICVIQECHAIWFIGFLRQVWEVHDVAPELFSVAQPALSHIFFFILHKAHKRTELSQRNVLHEAKNRWRFRIFAISVTSDMPLFCC